MQELHKINDKQSFDNFLEYKDELENKYSRKLGTTDKKAIYNAVIDEMREKKLISEYFHENQKETISFLGDDDSFKDAMCMFLNIYIVFFVVGLIVIIITGEFKNLSEHTNEV